MVNQKKVQMLIKQNHPEFLEKIHLLSLVDDSIFDRSANFLKSADFLKNKHSL
jgi:hypothetical protein